MNSKAILKVKNISKDFGLTHALKDVCVEIEQGEIIGLIGENGSGKSTLSSIISGVYPASLGELELDGEFYKPSDTRDAQMHGISMIAQEMGTLPGIRVADNIFLGKEHLFAKAGVINRKKMYQEALKAMEKIGITNIRPEAPIVQYSLEDRKLIEVVRALYSNPKIFIVDETTTALSQRGRDIIYGIIKQFRKENKTVLFISHDLKELMEICTQMIVLRDGVLIAQLEKEEFNEEKIKELMVGRKLTGDYYRSDYDGHCEDEVVLSADNLYIGTSLKGVSLKLHKGEILGIGGLTDCGMHELGKALFGVKSPLYGEVRLQNQEKIISEKQAIKNKIGYVSKNRDQEALILSASIMENIVIPSYPKLKKGPLILKKSEKEFTNKQVESLNIKCREITQDVRELSGGNKQKVVFGKWLGNESEIFILDCPTRGIDIGVKAFMYQLMYQLKKEGKSIIMISEELPELIGMSDRILIMKDGKIQKSFERSESLNETKLIREMV
ncbi:sugar ABC transporter ATP-binding protein [Lachnotalea glycerini]|uniref:Sugar ABC transporter ATP-binding protein n=1 Tax=Lachnotalea glycerini TaxID=1763509 RepID=A0A371JKP0_9FIRM|nr:sugar ABC transporter ATP-binding protein [Lachnotalea glycerini]RDY33293.1 sugar ABC transporter ATP-binding protein [Lachnotalea glycerini]